MASKKRFNFNRIKVFIIIGVFVYTGVTFYNQQDLINSQTKKQEELISIEDELKNKIEFYKNELEYIGSIDYIEKQARERYGWLKEGETKYIEAQDGMLIPEEQTQEATQNPLANDTQDTPLGDVSPSPTVSDAVGPEQDNITE